MYWPCQRGYLFGELVAYSPAKREVPGSTRPAGAVSHCYSGATILPIGCSPDCFRVVQARATHSHSLSLKKFVILASNSGKKKPVYRMTDAWYILK